MSAQHTPGPWTYVEDDKYSEELAHIIGADGSLVCDFGCSTQYYPTSGSEPSDADARLIAAAPELLEAIQGFMRKGMDGAEEYEAAVKAISKALGGFGS